MYIMYLLKQTNQRTKKMIYTMKAPYNKKMIAICEQLMGTYDHSKKTWLFANLKDWQISNMKTYWNYTIKSI